MLRLPFLSLLREVLSSARNLSPLSAFGGRGKGIEYHLIYARTLGAPKLVGGIALRETNSEESAELDYWIARPCWGLGFATEAGQAVVGMARQGLRLKSLRSGHFPNNPASGRVLDKLGFAPNGAVEKRWSAVRGEDVDCIMYEHTA